VALIRLTELFPPRVSGAESGLCRMPMIEG
jgi:hypothetical protein